jgi:ankyrin repeat protein
MLLDMAVSFGRATAIAWLLDHGADANGKDADGTVPLHRAAIMATREPNRQIKAMELLLSHGAKIDQANEDGMTALHFGAGLHNREVVSFLLDHGADPSIMSKDRRTAIEMAKVGTFGTTPLRVMSQVDIGEKQQTIDVLTAALTRHRPDGSPDQRRDAGWR